MRIMAYVFAMGFFLAGSLVAFPNLLVVFYDHICAGAGSDGLGDAGPEFRRLTRRLCIVPATVFFLGTILFARWALQADRESAAREARKQERSEKVQKYGAGSVYLNPQKSAASSVLPQSAKDSKAAVGKP